MFRKKFLVVSLIVGVVVSASLLILNQRGGAQTEQRPPAQDLSAQKKPFERTEIRVVIKPMKVNDAAIPVETECEPVFIERPDTLDYFSCVLVNNTEKSIRASSVRYSLLFDSDGRQGRTDRLHTADSYIHPDLSEVKKPTVPGGRLFILAPGPLTERNSVINTLELEPLYLEFSDGSTVGTDTRSAEMIAKVREGAAKYKNAVRQEYLNKGRSVKAILPRFENKADQEALPFAQRAGANAYRRFLRKKYDEAGAAAISVILDKQL